LDDYWNYFLANDAKLSWGAYRKTQMKAWNLVQTPWRNDTMPSQGADYSWPGDNFKIAFPG